MTRANFDHIETDIRTAIDAAGDLRVLDAVRVAALGKKGTVSTLLKTLGDMSASERAEQGALINGLKTRITDVLTQRKKVLEAESLQTKLDAEALDITLPSKADPVQEGRIHPISQVMDEIATIFAALDFDIADGPDVETDFYNFTALNIPENHPARQMHDTFYFAQKPHDPQYLLRTHTSCVQIRKMEAGAPPFRFIAPGRAYRCDSDQTHTPMFHQVEGVVIDTDTHLGHLKWTLRTFLAAFFEVDDVAIRLRPSYFPFTEPSMEIDIQCMHMGTTLRIGEGDEWMEIGGSGMVHPRVLEHVGIDPATHQGFAFGMGIDRLAMLKYGMPDLRAFFDADLRWLKHYGFLPLDVPGIAYGLSQK